ncbi:unnamed protein product [Brassica rapa subsp. narinosa]
MLESADDISSGSGGFTATPLSKRKNEQDDDSCLEDQHSVNKKLSQKKLKGEGIQKWNGGDDCALPSHSLYVKATT